MDRDQAKRSEILECTLCSYTTTSAYEILRHESGLLHHVKLEQKNRKCKHKCLLCGVTTESLKDFGRHANEATHQARIALPPLLPPQQTAASHHTVRASSQPIGSSAKQQQQVWPCTEPRASNDRMQISGKMPSMQNKAQSDERKQKARLKKKLRKQRVREEKAKLMEILRTQPSSLQKPTPSSKCKDSTFRKPVVAVPSQVQPGSFAPATVAAAQRPKILAGLGTTPGKKADRVDRSTVLRQPKTDCVNRVSAPWQSKADGISRSPVLCPTSDRQPTSSWRSSAPSLLTSDSTLTVTASAPPEYRDKNQPVPSLVNGSSKRLKNWTTAADSARRAKLSEQLLQRAVDNVAISDAVGSNPADCDLFANSRATILRSSDSAAGLSEPCPASDDARRVVRAVKEHTPVHAAVRPMSSCDVQVNEPFVRLIPLVFDYRHKSMTLPAALSLASGSLVSHRSPAVGGCSSPANASATEEATALTTAAGAAASADITSNSGTGVNDVGSRPKAKLIKPPKKAATERLRCGSEDSSRFVFGRPPAASASRPPIASCTSEVEQSRDTSVSAVSASLDTTTASLVAARTEVAAAGDMIRPPLSSDVNLNDVAMQGQPSELPVIVSEASCVAGLAKPFGSKPPDDEDVLGLVSSALSTKDRLRLKKIYTLARRNASAAKSQQQGPELGRAQKLRTFHLDGDDAGSCCDTAFRLLDSIELETLSADEQLQLTSIVSSVLLTEDNAGFASATDVGESIAVAKAHSTGAAATAAAEAFCNRTPLVAVKSEPTDTLSGDQAEAGGCSSGTTADLSFPALPASAVVDTSELTSSDRAETLEAAARCTAASMTLGSEAKPSENESPAEVSLATLTMLPPQASHSYLSSASGRVPCGTASPAKKTASRQHPPGGRPPRLAQSIGSQQIQAKKLHVGTTASDWLSSANRKRRAQHITESLVARSDRNSPACGYSAAKRRNVMAAVADSSCSSSEGAGCRRMTECSTGAIGDTAVASIAVSAPDALPVGLGISHDPDHQRDAPSGADSSFDPSPTTIQVVPRRNMESGVRADSIDRGYTFGSNSYHVSAARVETAVQPPVMLLDGHSDGSSQLRFAPPPPSSECCDGIAAVCEPVESSLPASLSTVVHSPTGNIGAACRTTGSMTTPGSTARLPFGPEALTSRSAGRASNVCTSAPVVAATASGSATTERLTNAIAAVVLRPAGAELPDNITSYRASATSPLASPLAAAVARHSTEARVSSPIGSQPQPMLLHRTSSAELISGVTKQQLPQEQQQPLSVEQPPMEQQPAAGVEPATSSAGCSNELPLQLPESASLTARLTELVDLSVRQGQVNQSLAQAHDEMTRLRDEISRLQATFDSCQHEAELLKLEKARLARASRDILTDLAIIDEASRLAATLMPAPTACTSKKKKDASAKQPRTKKKVPSTKKLQQNPSRDGHVGEATGGSNREIESICVKVKQEVLESKKDNEVPAMNTEHTGVAEHSSRTDGTGKKRKTVRRATPTEAATVTVGSCPTNSDSSQIVQFDSEQGVGGKPSLAVEQQLPCPTTTYGGHTGAILDITARGGHLYTGSLDCTARKYDFETGKCLTVYSGHTGAVRAVRVVGNERQGYQLYTGTSSGILTVFNSKTGEAVGHHDLRSAVHCMCDAWDYIYVGLESGKVTSLLTTMSTAVDSFACSEQAVTCLSTATEGGRRLLCVGSQDQSVTLRDARSGLLIRELILPGDLRPAVLMVSEEESVIYVAAKKSHVLAFSIETAEQIMSFSQPCRGGWIKSAVLLSGKRLLTASTDSYVRLIDLETKAVINVYRGDPSCIMLCMCCSSGTFFTGDSAGHVVGQRLSAQRFPCKHANCALTFGWHDHLQQHVAKEHSTPADSSCRDVSARAVSGKPPSVDGERRRSESGSTGEQLQVTTGRSDTALPAAGSGVRAARSAANGDRRSRQLKLK